MSFILAGWGFLVIIVLIHEFGHAIPALWLTKEKVSIHLGFRQPGIRRIRLPLGRVDVYATINPLRWKQGLCYSSKANLSKRRKIAIIVGGPIMSLLLCVISWLVIVLWRPAGWEEAVTLFNQRRFAESSEKFEQLISGKKPNRTVVLYAVSANIFAKRYDHAMALRKNLQKQLRFDFADYCNFGVIHSSLGKHDEARQDLEHALSLADVAETHAYLGRYHWHKDDVGAAEECFKKAAQLDPDPRLDEYRIKIAAV